LNFAEWYRDPVPGVRDPRDSNPTFTRTGSRATDPGQRIPVPGSEVSVFRDGIVRIAVQPPLSGFGRCDDGMFG
jgi:hypothetical protein